MTDVKRLRMVGVVIVVMLALSSVGFGVNRQIALVHARDDLTASESRARLDHRQMQDTQDALNRSLAQVRRESNETKAKLEAAEKCMHDELQLLDFAVSLNWSAYDHARKTYAKKDCAKAGL